MLKKIWKTSSIAPLLIRDGRKLLLTDTGRVVFERGRAILGEFSQLKAELSDINHLNKGVLRPGIPPMVGMLMAEPISRFRLRYPGVELKNFRVRRVDGAAGG